MGTLVAQQDGSGSGANTENSQLKLTRRTKTILNKNMPELARKGTLKTRKESNTSKASKGK